jgi:photosystem II stability/assembly factor-like uncharacterized protein
MRNKNYLKMKKTIARITLILLLSVISLNITYADWTQVGTLSNLGSFPSISAVNDQIFFIAGGPAGTPVIYKTTNNGLSYVSVPTTGITAEIYCIWAVNVNTIYVGSSPQLGGDARVFKTTNGGTTWTTLFTINGTNAFINGIVFSRSNPQVGIIQCDPPNGNGTPYWLAKTTNGGLNWVISNLAGVDGNLSAQNSVFCIDANFYGFGLNSSPQILFTSNGGTTWIQKALTGAQGSTGFVTSIAFSNDKLNGVAAGWGTSSAISRTTNGGVTWFAQPISILNPGDQNYGELKWVPGFNTVYLTVSNASAESFKSEDNGATWTSIPFLGSSSGITHMDLAYSASSSQVATISKTGALFRLTDSPLPVELTSFTYNVSNRDVNLKWITTMEQNNSGFEIYRNDRNDPENWIKAGFVKGNGNTNTTTEYNFTDKKLSSGKYDYKIKQIDYNGNFEYYTLSGTVEIANTKKINLAQNYPNPFNPVTNIDYELPQDSKVMIKVYDISGRVVSELVNLQQKAGFYTIQFNASNIASGNYFYQMITNANGNSTTITKRMVVIK